VDLDQTVQDQTDQDLIDQDPTDQAHMEEDLMVQTEVAQEVDLHQDLTQADLTQVDQDLMVEDQIDQAHMDQDLTEDHMDLHHQTEAHQDQVSLTQFQAHVPQDQAAHLDHSVIQP